MSIALFSNTISLLEKALDYSQVKQNVISNNIANVDTPNYKAKEVSFRSFFNDEMSKISAKTTDKRHIPFQSSASPYIVTSQKTNYNNNGNNVDVDQEMSELAANQIYYNAMAESISNKFQALQTVIRGGN